MTRNQRSINLDMKKYFIIFFILILLGYTMPEYNGSLNHILIVNCGACFMGILGGLEL